MAAKNCARCNNIFEYLSGPPLCPSCRELDEQEFKKVREYLYDHKEATIMEVSKTLDVSIKKINRFIKEGRLELKYLKNISLECRSCGKPIESGEYCDKCKMDLSKNFKSGFGSGIKKGNNQSLGKSKRLDGFYSRKNRD